MLSVSVVVGASGSMPTCCDRAVSGSSIGCGLDLANLRQAILGQRQILRRPRGRLGAALQFGDFLRDARLLLLGVGIQHRRVLRRIALDLVAVRTWLRRGLTLSQSPLSQTSPSRTCRARSRGSNTPRRVAVDQHAQQHRRMARIRAGSRDALPGAPTRFETSKFEETEGTRAVFRGFSARC